RDARFHAVESSRAARSERGGDPLQHLVELAFARLAVEDELDAAAVRARLELEVRQRRTPPDEDSERPEAVVDGQQHPHPEHVTQLERAAGLALEGRGKLFGP